jgi:nickel-dependent lactate racemase
MATIDLPYGKRTLTLTLPDIWLGHVAIPRRVRPAGDAEEILRQALHTPIGSPRLSELVRRGQRVAVIVDDFSRKTPVARFLPLVLDELRRAGVGISDTTIVMALGTHRPMTADEIKAKVGERIAASMPIVNSPSHAEEQTTFLGTSSNGIPAWVNRAVVEADVRIGLGMITPHSDAGFSGGSKIILPGVCSSQTVNAFHAATAYHGETQLGQVDSVIRRDLEQFVAEKAPLAFIVNVIFTLDGEIAQCVAGHPVLAHRRGVSHALRVFSVSIPHKYPVVVANCFPYDLDLWLSTKGAFCGGLVTPDGGTLIVVTAATEGNSNYPQFPAYLGTNPESLMEQMEGGVSPNATLASESVKLWQLRRRANLVMVSDGLTDRDFEAMGIRRLPTIEAAVEEAVYRLPASQRDRSVCVIPEAGVVLPVLEPTH